MNKINIIKIKNYLNTKLLVQAPWWFEYFKHKTTPSDVYWTFEVLNENQSNDNVMERDLMAFTFYSPAVKWPYNLLEVLDEFKKVFYWANKDIGWFKTRSIDQLWKLDEILPKWVYRTTLTVNITYAT